MTDPKHSQLPSRGVMLNIHDCQTAGAHIFMGQDDAKAIYHRVNTWDALVEACEAALSHRFPIEALPDKIPSWVHQMRAALAAAEEEK